MRILATVITSLGAFDGRIEHEGELTRQQAVELVDTIGQSINGLDRLTIRHDDGSETIFGQAVLAGAILRLQIDEESEP